MPAWLRWAWLLVGLLGAIVLALKSLLPVLRYRVNVLYARDLSSESFPSCIMTLSMRFL